MGGRHTVGTRDGLASPAEVRGNAGLLPAHTRWIWIEGGNHFQFGWYGFQPRGSAGAHRRFNSAGNDDRGRPGPPACGRHHHCRFARGESAPLRQVGLDVHELEVLCLADELPQQLAVPRPVDHEDAVARLGDPREVGEDLEVALVSLCDHVRPPASDACHLEILGVQRVERGRVLPPVRLEQGELRHAVVGRLHLRDEAPDAADERGVAVLRRPLHDSLDVLVELMIDRVQAPVLQPLREPGGDLVHLVAPERRPAAKELTVAGIERGIGRRLHLDGDLRRPERGQSVDELRDLALARG
ncbi:MAG: hypothetical protein H0X64_08040 [Gemmatimonadaceae bacterium]|nr:hypothetical protein [Gemmatimonadaceae bacterium]